MRPRQFTKYVADFETTTYEGQIYTEVWAAALVPIEGDADPLVFSSIVDFYDYLVALNENLIIYFHNLKFDGQFLLFYFLAVLHYKHACRYTQDGEVESWLDDKDMRSKTIKYNISEMGQWYTISVKQGEHIIRFQDSLKLIPRSVKQMGKDFNTPHRKLEIEYHGYRAAGGVITKQEKAYIQNDVLVVKEALQYMFDEGHDRLTIGSCCLSEYKHLLGGQKAFAELFPDLFQLWIDPRKYDVRTVGDYIHRAYHGGWCYVKKGVEGIPYDHGCTADANSLYPSQMSSESGNVYPYGIPQMFQGEIPPEAKEPDRFYYVRIRTRFYLKDGYLPFVQIKGDLHYNGNEMLESSDVKLETEINGKKVTKSAAFYKGLDGEIKDTRVTLTLTQTDYELLREHYDLVDLEILDGCYFRAMKGLFDEYIERYKKLKIEADTPGKRTIAKLYLNNLYGKFAASRDSTFKVAYEGDDHILHYYPVEAYDKTPGYIAVGAAVTSYARNHTIRIAQKNYKHFLYADTDSIHCACSEDELVGVPIHPKDFCHWKVESYWNFAMFIRQKTYVEKVTHEDGEQLPAPYYNLKCAGMTERCKDMLLMSITGKVIKENKEIKDEEEKQNYLGTLSDPERSFIKERRTWDDFTVGLKVPGKLMPVRIRGGVVLKESFFEIRNNVRFI